MDYYDLLPRYIFHEVRCCHLNNNGQRCQKTASIECFLHENINTENWHVAFFCVQHADERNKIPPEIIKD